MVRIARGLNDLWKRTGSVFDDHDHARALVTPREVRNALVYVLHNARKHGWERAGIDPCSSGPWFDGWSRSPAPLDRRGPAPVARARTWLLAQGWRRHGLLRPDERPATRPGERLRGSEETPDARLARPTAPARGAPTTRVRRATRGGGATP
jgi:hypothetical protein